MKSKLAWLSLSLLSSVPLAQAKDSITVGSKTFTESYILAEIFSQTIEEVGEAEVNRKFGLGATGIIFEAVSKGDIDLYPEYTGTITEAFLKTPARLDLAAIEKQMAPLGLIIGGSLGFNDTYALAISPKFAEKSHLKKISDLNQVSAAVRAGFTHEFMNREDGFNQLKQSYQLNLQNVQTLAHSLAYEAIEHGEIDLTDIYSTDAKIGRLHLTTLKDDRNFFPGYFAVILARANLAQRFPKSWAALKKLDGVISEAEMIQMNGQAEIEKKSFANVAGAFLEKKGLKKPQAIQVPGQQVWQKTKEHLFLVGFSLLASLLIGVPLGILSYKNRSLGQVILVLSSVIQTIPSLALLCLLIPLLGIGVKPALVALFLYGLLPIVLNTSVGLSSIDLKLIESARALGLTTLERLRWIELPLASPSILSGIKTSAIIGIGTATLAALIGAGGYGSLIITGLALNDIPTVLQGAIPAAIMALAAHGVFELLNPLVIPKGLR